MPLFTIRFAIAFVFAFIAASVSLIAAAAVFFAFFAAAMPLIDASIEPASLFFHFDAFASLLFHSSWPLAAADIFIVFAFRHIALRFRAAALISAYIRCRHFAFHASCLYSAIEIMAAMPAGRHFHYFLH